MMDTPEARWKAMIAWSNSCFETFMAFQLAQGRTREQALDLLRRSWAIADEDKMAGYAEMARLISRAQ